MKETSLGHKERVNIVLFIEKAPPVGCLKPERKEALCLILIVMVPREAVITESNFAFRSPATKMFPTGSPLALLQGRGPALGPGAEEAWGQRLRGWGRSTPFASLLMLLVQKPPG